ncbi:carbamoyltransferase [Sphaerisporangium rufum]|uniref:Carbamoyltransferase n=1 Tax=Sphaerisporangium rufum TaxID=1381558 RepID=A0A919RCI6_9ACTN|nr:carbamoyltransferase C-terminal domain-containing protein [Sphaerisporangium rufum]GII81487.1 carbamoyltransferase [Sphaerisporangium rufum]
MKFLGINAIFHDPAAALVVDGEVVAAAEEERFSRRKHGKRPVPFSAWEPPELAARWCLAEAGISPGELDAVAYSYDPALVIEGGAGQDPAWEGLRTRFAERAPWFLSSALPGLDPGQVRFVPHHVAHAASAGLAAPFDSCAVLVCDGRGEAVSHLAGVYRGGEVEVLAAQPLPHSLGLLYEEVTEHLGFLRSSDEYKVMALASYGSPRFAPLIREAVHATGDGGFVTEPVEWGALAKPVGPGETPQAEHADLAASVQDVLQEVLLDLAGWLHARTGERFLAMAGGVALNCVANTVLAERGPFEQVWVQPAAGDAGTALGGALHLAAAHGEAAAPMPGADLGRGWSDEEIVAWLDTVRVPYTRPADLPGEVAAELAADRVIAWFQGRSEFGPRALGRRSLLAHPGFARNTERLNDVKGREQFRPIAPMVLASRAGEIFSRGPLPSPYMLFVHDVAPPWRERIPAVVHVDGTARVQTVDEGREPALVAMLRAFEARTGLPVVVNTSLNTAGRPMVDDPRDALECFGSAPIDVLAIGPCLIRRGDLFR